jgi:hypothetical protein
MACGCGLDRTELWWDPVASFCGYGNENWCFINGGKYLEQSSNSRKKHRALKLIHEGQIFDQTKLTVFSQRITCIFPPIFKIMIRYMKIH